MKNISLKIAIIIGITSVLSCKNFLEITPPKDGLITKAIFESDDVATSTITGIYNRMVNSGYASGDFKSITSVCGLSSDEFINNGTALAEFYENKVVETSNTVNTSLWSIPYQNIYAANSVLEQLRISVKVTQPVKTQLEGEAHFIRAFCYFNLVNLFGPIPLHLTTDYRNNEKAFRTPTSQVYEQILTDLKIAEGLLTDQYVTSERIRPNLAAVQALLARTYLYTADWKNAEKYATQVINKAATYKLVDVDQVFLKNSPEAIWQLMPNTNTTTNEGNLFILVNTPIYGSLRPSFAINGFELGDKRKSAWINSFSNSTGTYYYPYKYKVKSSTSLTEYSMVFRLAEQFLIRAEARMKQDIFLGALNDVNVIRKRAGITLIKDMDPNTEKQILLNAIQKERFNELFSEWGHRWFDLKRTGNAHTVLGPLKSGWQLTDILYPIPQQEISRNSNIIQNEGY